MRRFWWSGGGRDDDHRDTESTEKTGLSITSRPCEDSSKNCLSPCPQCLCGEVFLSSFGCGSAALWSGFGFGCGEPRCALSVSVLLTSRFFSWREDFGGCEAGETVTTETQRDLSVTSVSLWSGFVFGCGFVVSSLPAIKNPSRRMGIVEVRHSAFIDFMEKEVAPRARDERPSRRFWEPF